MSCENIDLSRLSQKELKRLAAGSIRLIKKPEEDIGTDLFEAVITIVPQPAIEAVVVDNLENPSKILATWRQDQHYRGWHFPGSFIRFGESYKKALKRLISTELGVGIKRYKGTGVNYSLVDSRGHTIGIVFLVELDAEPTKPHQWFDYVPEELLKHHKSFLKKVLRWK